MICKKNFFVLILFSTLFSFVWSFHTYSEPWIDFGNYFFMSDIISYDYRLYKEYFDHKGPLIFLLFGTYTKFFGTDLVSAQFLLFIILLIFYSVISLFISKIINSFKYQIFFLLLSFNILYNQSPDLIILLLQLIFVLTSFYFFIFFSSSSFFKYFFCTILMFLSSLVRIDSLIYMSAFFFFFLCEYRYRKFIIYGLASLFFALSLFFIIKLFFKFSLSEYFLHNLDFNRYYQSRQSSLYYIYRPITLSIFLTSGVGLFFFVFLYKSEINFLFVKRFSKYLIFLILSFLLFWLTKYDKDYQLIITLPFFFILLMVIFDFNKEILSHKSYFFLLLYILLINLWTLSYPLITIKDKFIFKNNFSFMPIDIFRNNIGPIYNDAKIMSNIDDLVIICSTSWDYIFANSIPKRPILDAWYYTFPGYKTEYFEKFHKELIQSKDKVFFIHPVCLSRDTTNEFKYLLKNSTILDKTQYYMMRKIN